MRKLLVLGILLAAIALGWFLRDRWTRTPGAERRTVAVAIWERLSPDAAQRARQSVASLERNPRGVARVTAGELASLLYEELVRQLPSSAEEIHAAVVGDLVYVRALVRLADLGGRDALGPLAAVLPERDTVWLGGTFEIVRPGLAQFRVREVRVGRVGLPRSVIPAVIRRMGRGARPEGIAEDALPLEIPTYIGDVRIGAGRVAIYGSSA